MVRPLHALTLALVGTLLFSGGMAAPPAAPPTEYEVKAAYLYYLATFIEWPAEAFGDDGAFVIGVVGDDPFGPILDQTLRDKTVHGRKLVLRRFASLSGEPGCNLLFIGSSEERHLDALLKTLQGSSVLTVAEIGGFTERGGHIGLRLEAQRVRFGINVDAVRRAGLRTSAQLLKLAVPGASASAAGAGPS
jgi:hypothetical protein